MTMKTRNVGRRPYNSHDTSSAATPPTLRTPTHFAFSPEHHLVVEA